ncbi:MAG: poly-gamma-glutamate biosynthesis protein PgsC [Candidatus Aminicenantes bacterium]|nr:poly-gamma-glutamate biosynthesis protein PgsC [Candidatus Aminicenantes bacterium]
MPFETIFIGLLLALLYKETMGLYPGGIIVPAYLALTLDHPVPALTTVAVACLSLLIYKLLARYFILFGSRRFVLILLVGGVLSQVCALAAPRLIASPLEFQVIGFIIPGLLANNLERQNFLPTLASLITVTVATYFIANLVRIVF